MVVALRSDGVAAKRKKGRFLIGPDMMRENHAPHNPGKYRSCGAWVCDQDKVSRQILVAHASA